MSRKLYDGFSLEPSNFPLFKIVDNNQQKKNAKKISKKKKDDDVIVYVHQREKDPNKLNREISMDNVRFQLVPTFDPSKNSESPRDVIYISGPSGSGKSYWAARYVEEYHKMYRKNSIVLITPKPAGEDKAFDSLKYIKRLILEENTFDKIDLDMCRNSLVIFDDWEGLPSDIRSSVFEFQKLIQSVGRSYGISIVVINHLSCNFHQTRLTISESNIIVIFPRWKTARSGYTRLLKTYCSFNKDQLERIFSLADTGTRAAAVYRNAPGPIVIADNGYAYFND